MNDLEKLLNSANSLSEMIGELLRKSTYLDYDDLSGLKIDYKDEEQLLLLDEFIGILEKLENAKINIDYLNKPIMYTGFLHKNRNGRYECKDHEYTSGNTIEALVIDDIYDVPRWTVTRVEHNGKDYYLVGYKNVQMEGLKIRIRKR